MPWAVCVSARESFRVCALLHPASPSCHRSALGLEADLSVSLGFQGPVASVFSFTCELLLQMERCLLLNIVFYV